MVPNTSNPEELGTHMHNEIAKWAKVVKALGCVPIESVLITTATPGRLARATTRRSIARGSQAAACKRSRSTASGSCAGWSSTLTSNPGRSARGFTSPMKSEPP